MAVAPHPSLLVSAGIGALVLWRVYSRVRRVIGRQKLSNVRPWITVTVFPLLLCALLAGSFAHPQNALALLAGAIFGGALGVYGLRLTRFEQTPQGLFYTPSAHLGIGLSLLFVGRLVYRGVQLYAFGGQAAPQGMGQMTGSPLTLIIFGTLAGYYVTYAIGLLRWRARVARNPVGTSQLSGSVAIDESADSFDQDRSQ